MKIKGVVESYSGSDNYNEITLKITDSDKIDLMRLVGMEVVVSLK